MKTKKAKVAWWCGSVLLAVLCWSWICMPTPAVAQTKSIARYFDPVEVPGDLLFMQFISSNIDQLRLFAQKGGVWEMIPFQIDERDTLGNFVLPSGPQGSKAGSDNVLNAQDTLCFMASDLGDRVVERDSIKGEGYTEALRCEIEVKDPLTGNKGWAYLVSFDGQPPALPETKKVNLNFSGLFDVSSKYYDLTGLKLTFGKKAIITNWPEKFFVSQAAGGDGRNFVDRVKVRAQALAKGKFRLSVDEASSKGGVLKYKTGPIRTIVHSSLDYPVPTPLSKVNKIKAFVDSYYYERIAIYTARTRGPCPYKDALSDVTIGMGLDLNKNAYGMKFANSVNPQEVTIDGVMSEEEKKFNPGHDEWRYYTGTQGSLVLRSLYDPDLPQYAKLTTKYTDNAETALPPESEPGQIGYLYDSCFGDKVFERWFSASYHLYIPDNFSQKKAEEKIKTVKEAVDVCDHPLVIRANDEEVLNEAATINPLVINAK